MKIKITCKNPECGAELTTLDGQSWAGGESVRCPVCFNVWSEGPSKTACTHQNTETKAGTSAVQNKAGQIVGFQLEASVHCLDCGVPFHFPGLPVCQKVAAVVSANNGATVLVVPMQQGSAPVINN